jgi:putative ABC transport system permease protein
LVVRQGLGLALLGCVAGLAGAAACTRFIASLLYGVGGIDVVTFAASAGLLLTVAFLACLLPARRAARVDPIIALRAE